MCGAEERRREKIKLLMDERLQHFWHKLHEFYSVSNRRMHLLRITKEANSPTECVAKLIEVKLSQPFIHWLYRTTAHGRDFPALVIVISTDDATKKIARRETCGSKFSGVFFAAKIHTRALTPTRHVFRHFTWPEHMAPRRRNRRKRRSRPTNAGRDQRLAVYAVAPGSVLRLKMKDKQITLRLKLIALHRPTILVKITEKTRSQRAIEANYKGDRC